MDVSVRGRNVGITDRFENYIEAKSEKVSGLLPKAQSFEVRVSRLSDRSPQNGDLVEITLIGPGPVIRAESAGADKYSAFDIAYGRVLERIRRMKDRRKIHKGRGPMSLGQAAAGDFGGVGIIPASAQSMQAVSAERANTEGHEPEHGQDEAQYTPVVIRSKEFPAERLTVEEAVDQMELVGHDFFLFVENETGRPSVVYRRKGWNYGVISLSEE